MRPASGDNLEDAVPGNLGQDDETLSVAYLAGPDKGVFSIHACHRLLKTADFYIVITIDLHATWDIAV